VALRLAFFVLFSVLVAGYVRAQSVSTVPKMACNITVTVTDASGAVISDAFVVLRADRSGRSSPIGTRHNLLDIRPRVNSQGDRE
jgi:hypothetical protein